MVGPRYQEITVIEKIFHYSKFPSIGSMIYHTTQSHMRKYHRLSKGRRSEWKAWERGYTLVSMKGKGKQNRQI